MEELGFTPLNQRVSFEGQIQRSNKVQIPKLIRWQHKIEPDQVLKVGVSVPVKGSGEHFFLAKMRKDGRIIIPKLTVAMLQGKEENLLGYILEITLEPA